MLNLRINEAETIFEPFYDGGESYNNHEKYSLLTNYRITYAPGAVANVTQQWMAVRIDIQSQRPGDYAVKMERDCNLDIREFDVFRMFARINEAFDIRITCCIDGSNVTVMELRGHGQNEEYDGKISGSTITHITIEIRSNAAIALNSELIWFGLCNAQRQQEMENRPSPYDDQWEGCFVEDAKIGPMIGIFFSEDELPALRKKLSKEPFKSMVDVMREKAVKAMELAPEQYISDLVPNHLRQLVHNRDMDRPIFFEHMDVLAFIGLLDNDLAMLRMACRKMLSVAMIPQWTETDMGKLPTATWWRRSFVEGEMCELVATVLDFAGSLLTWHGKNLIYDALMMKGLPRMEADFHSVDYLRETNQGIVFNHGRIMALFALAHRYPRYEARLKVAAEDEREMIDRYVKDDGGTPEGCGYWNYTFSNAIATIALLARHEHKTLREYAWDKLKKTGDFAVSMLSDIGDGTEVMPINDAHYGTRYHPILSASFAQISDDPRWRILYAKTFLNYIRSGAEITLNHLLLAPDVEPMSGELSRDGFFSLNITGHTSLRRTTEDVGRVHCYLSGGFQCFCHNHGDKGQIVLEVDRIPILIDRGVCSYDDPNVNVIFKASRHNLFYPEAPEGAIEFDQNRYEKSGATVLRSSYENGIFDYCTDTLNAWDDGIFHSVTRSVYSDDAHRYVIRDDAVFLEELASSFRLHTHGEITEEDGHWIISDGGYRVIVTPLNYTPERVVFGEDGVDSDLHPVNSLKIYLPKATEQHIETLLEVSRKP